MREISTYAIKRIEKEHGAMAITSELEDVNYYVANPEHKEDGIVITRNTEEGIQQIVFTTAEIDTLISDIKAIKETFL